jgi:replicative DNA helicase
MPPLPCDFLTQLASKYDLSPEQKEVFIKYFASEKTGWELAKQLNISDGAWRTRMTQVYRKFSIGGKGPSKFYKLRDFLDGEYKKSQKSNPFPENEVDIASLRQNIQQKKAKQNLVSIKTGFEVLDNFMDGGIMPSSLVTIAGCTAMGKSSFLASIVNYKVIVDRSSIVFFSLQNSYKQLIKRLYEIQVYSLYKTNPGYTEKNLEILTNKFSHLYSNFLLIDDTPGIKISKIESICYKIAQEEGLDIAIIDGLEVLEYDTSFSPESSILKVSQRIKNLAKVLDIPILVTCPIISSNLEKRTNKRPMGSDMGEYRVLETISDVLIFLYRDTFYWLDNIHDRGIGEVIVAKNRYGCTGVVKLAFSTEVGYFYNLEKKDERENLGRS